MINLDYELKKEPVRGSEAIVLQLDHIAKQIASLFLPAIFTALNQQ